MVSQRAARPYRARPAMPFPAAVNPRRRVVSACAGAWIGIVLLVPGLACRSHSESSAPGTGAKSAPASPLRMPADQQDFVKKVQDLRGQYAAATKAADKP